MMRGYLEFCRASICELRGQPGYKIDNVARVLGRKWLAMPQKDRNGWAIRGGEREPRKKGNVKATKQKKRPVLVVIVTTDDED
jgi:hypothetical protein